MAAVVACSPTSVHGAAFKSPHHNFRQEACDRFGSDEIYGDARARVVQWRKDFLSAASFEAQQGLRELHHEQEHLKDLNSDLTVIQGLVQVASQMQNDGARLAEVLNGSSEAGTARGQAIACISDELHRCCERQKEELQQQQQKIAEQREVANAQHAEALKLLDVYKNRLGLTISRVAAQTVLMSFTLIDDSNPTKEFSFVLGIADTGKTGCEGYSVCDCTPYVSELPTLLEDLNSHVGSATALPRFVSSMRREFIKAARTVLHL